MVVDTKKLKPAQEAGVVEDIERGVANGIRPLPWQTDTCIGDWHYSRPLFERHGYKTVGQVVRMLVDIVSKNGNLLLSVPVRGNGELDEDEIAFLQGLARWMELNGDGIFGTRPWKIYGEGPSTEETAEAGQFGGARDVRSKPYTAADLRFTTNAGTLYAFVLAWPEDRSVLVKSLATGASTAGGRKATDVTLLGYDGKIAWSQDAAGLHVRLPEGVTREHALALKISGVLAD